MDGNLNSEKQENQNSNSQVIENGESKERNDVQVKRQVSLILNFDDILKTIPNEILNNGTGDGNIKSQIPFEFNYRDAIESSSNKIQNNGNIKDQVHIVLNFGNIIKTPSNEIQNNGNGDEQVKNPLSLGFNLGNNTNSLIIILNNGTGDGNIK